LLGALAAAVAVVGTLIYLDREAIFGGAFGSHVVGGQPAVSELHAPAGFRVTVFATGLAGPRFLTFGPDGTLYQTERSSGDVVALTDPGRTGTATGRVVVASGMNDPTSVIWHDGAIYVGEQTQVTRWTVGADHRATDRTVIVRDLPAGGQHVTRTVLIGADGMLYVSIGSTCNDCVEADPHRAAVWQYATDGSGGRLYARGLRNAVGLAANPVNGAIWATDMGRDLLGDDTPPETIYSLVDGGNYGWPVCHAGDIIDPDLGHQGDCDGVQQPLVKMQAHSAPLGLVFATAAPFPPAYRGLFVAFHGSWNRTVPTGYKVVFLPLDARGQIAGPPRDFLTGFLKDSDDASGRPVGLAIGPDGALYVSDDKAGVVYRVAYVG
jgi:glucose/arabinose dehydrogenase